MAEEEAPEEVLRLVEAVDAFDAIEDDAACALALTQVLEDWPTHHSKLRLARRERVNRMRAQGQTWAEIGQAMGGLSAARAQQIGAGLRGSKRPKKKTEEPPGD
ncbi:hypothetical protein [Streptomyces sp. NBC_00198]|uniref:hypothetical protein n=1 Tax=Streptomyces sp. NBC_00198 TaxID=2975677 RepID=UPI00225507A2|nr:hypothetical protein [Streptomyces sp. NBC_00198]MCX5285943.1 hypothetical protein [Streptomyces sp. NBC_00198]MCX5286252.1 hypothetical protein [Streptomyces sp. NBC_00198]